MKRFLSTIFTIKTAICALTAFFFAASAAEEGLAQSKPAVWWTLDCSGSMWGRSGGIPKYRRSLDLMRGTMAAYKDAEYGLITFGRRDRGDCGDIEILVRPSASGADSILKLMAAIRPNGKSPIARTLETAGGAVEPSRDNYLVLLSDGIEACDGNPVEQAAALAESGAIKAIHTVYFPYTDGDTLTMRSIADASGGTFRSIFSPAAAPGWVAESREPLVLETVPPAPAAPQYGLIGYKAFIRQENGFPAYGSVAKVRLEDGTELADKTIWKGIIEEVPPGVYSVEVSNADTTLALPCTVTANSFAYLPFAFDIPTGGINYRCIVNGSEQIHAYNSLVRIFHENGEVVFTGNQWRGSVQNLPAGQYRLTAANQDIVREDSALVVKKDSAEVIFNFPLETGRISYECYLDSARQKPAYGVGVRIYSLPYEEIVMDDSTRWRGQSALLPAGKYIISCNFFGQIINNVITIMPNDNYQSLIIFNVEQVRFSYECYRSDTNNPANGTEVRIVNPGGIQVEQATGWRGSFLIPAGPYTMIATYQEQEIRKPIILVPTFSAKSPEKIYFP